jgi:hypothetical protein
MFLPKRISLKKMINIIIKDDLSGIFEASNLLL